MADPQTSGHLPRKKPRLSSKPSSKSHAICVVHLTGLKPDKYGEIKLLSKDDAGMVAKIQDIKRRRLAEPLNSPHRMTVICNQIPDEFSENHGYHRECYKRFTMNLNRLTQAQNESEQVVSRPSRKSGDNLLFTPDCIFCNSEKWKKIKVQGSWTSEGLSQFEFGGWQDIEKEAEVRGDEKLLTRIRGKDLFACEAKYHRTCRKAFYMQNPEKWRSQNDEQRLEQIALEEAHKLSFDQVCKVIDDEVLLKKKMMELSDLTKLYISYLDNTDFPNPEYRSYKLKDKLLSDPKYSKCISICGDKNTKGQHHGYLVYSSDITKDEAILKAYELGSCNIHKESGNQLHDIINKSFKDADNLKWPPSAVDLEECQLIPSELETFLCHVIAKEPVAKTQRSQRLVLSIAQDICRAATRGEWKMPKHVLLGMTLRHLYRSEQLVTLLNRLGHCENYSYTLELETGIAKAIEETSSLLSTQIIRAPECKSVFHSEFDNFDQLLNTVNGKESIHTAHGIMLQDLEGPPENHTGVCVEIPSIEKGKQRSLTLEPQELRECYITVRQSPNLTITATTYPGGEESFHEANLKHMLWIWARSEAHLKHKPVPGITGFLSKTKSKPKSLTSIDYYPVIAHPITEYKTVQECLKYAEEATQEVQQRYTITTFDLGVCMKAYPITWNNAEKYQNHIILIGTFHLACGYMKMLGKKMDGSGFSDILLEAGLIGSGSLQGVISGKHYDRALHCHKVLTEALEQLLFRQYQENNSSDLSPESQIIFEKIVDVCDSEAIKSAMMDGEVNTYLDKFLGFRKECKEGSLGKTAQLWLSYMDHVQLLLALIHAVKHNNFNLYAHCIHAMTPIFFSFNGQNYARYLSYFSMFLCNIETSHPGSTDLLKQGAISVARSFIPGNGCDVDKTMEETFMRHAKSHGSGGTGITGILTNHEAYQRWVRTTHARSQFVNSMFNFADMQQSESQEHRDLKPTEIVRSQKHTAKAIRAVESFLNPFSVDTKDKVLILSSGQSAPGDIENDVLNADLVGREKRDLFIEDRLKKNRDFFEPIKRLNIKTLGRMNKKTSVKSVDNKVIQYKQQGNVAFQLFLGCQQLGIHVELEELVKYPLTPVPYSLATADGFFCKTDKTTILHQITKGVQNVAEPLNEETLTIYDGNACFYMMRDVPSNFQLISQNAFLAKALMHNATSMSL